MVLGGNERACADPGLLQRLDLAVHLTERRLVRGREVQAAGHLGHALHQDLVDVTARARRDGADRVDADADQLRDLRGIDRQNIARVLRPVGEEDRDLAARRGLAHHIESRREPDADGRSVAEGFAGRDRLHQPLRRRVVERQRAEHHRLRREDDDAHAIVREPAEESCTTSSRPRCAAARRDPASSSMTTCRRRCRCRSLRGHRTRPALRTGRERDDTPSRRRRAAAAAANAGARASCHARVARARAKRRGRRHCVLARDAARARRRSQRARAARAPTARRTGSRCRTYGCSLRPQRGDLVLLRGGRAPTTSSAARTAFCACAGYGIA